MDRKYFLKVLWDKFLKPLLLLGVFFFSIRFLIRAFSQNGTERMIATLVIAFIILSILSYFSGILFKNIYTKIKLRLSEGFLQKLKITGKIFNHILPIAIGTAIYYSWQENSLSALGFYGIFLIYQIINIVRKKKTAKANLHSRF